MARQLFRYSPLDAYLVLIGVSNVAVILASLLFFNTLPIWALALLFVYIAYCYCWNLQCISHNFIHNPFFRAEWLNHAFGLVETLALGLPHTIVYHQHLNHHVGDNDVKGPNGTTKDWVSSYRYGKDGRPEPVWRYALLSLFRFPVGDAMKLIWRRGASQRLQFLAEVLVLGGFVAGLIALDWRYFVFFYLPCYYAGWVSIYAENYFLHYGAQPGNRYANSVSSYHRFYNWIFFNNGYHQEHHSRPRIHWSKLEAVRTELLPEMTANKTRIIRGPHPTVLLEEWFERRKALTTETA